MEEDAMELQSGSDMALRRRGIMLTRMQRLALRAHGAALALHAWTPARIALHPLSIAVAATFILIAGAPSAAVLALLVQIGLAIWMAQRDPPAPAPPRFRSRGWGLVSCSASASRRHRSSGWVY
jgi:hypothetical protein